jgi:excisionase family DNA binding protein
MSDVDVCVTCGAPAPLLTDAEVAERLRISRRTLQAMCRAGAVPYVRLAGRYMFTPGDVAAIVAGNHHEPEVADAQEPPAAPPRADNPWGRVTRSNRRQTLSSD